MNIGVSFFCPVTLWLSITVFAQAPVGNISGVVSDPTGAVIPNAKLSVTSLSRRGKRTVVSNESGFYLISTLLPGEYQLVAESPGFAKYTVDRVVAAVGQTTRVDPTLALETATQAVEVHEASVGVETAGTGVGGVIASRQIDELPLNGRNYLELAQLQPGVEIQAGGTFDPTKSRYSGISVGGREGRESRITIDGIDAVDE